MINICPDLILGATGLAGVDRDGNPVGDLTGSYPGPIVKALQTHPIDPDLPTTLTTTSQLQFPRAVLYCWTAELT